MARTKQSKKVKPFGSPETKLINKAIVKAKHKSVKKKAASVLASSHKDQKVGLFLVKDMQDAMDIYRQSRLTGFGERPLSIRALCERFKGKNITFGHCRKGSQVKSPPLAQLQEVKADIECCQEMWKVRIHCIKLDHFVFPCKKQNNPVFCNNK